MTERIDTRGREIFSWDLTDAPAGNIEITFDGDTWQTMTRVGDTVSILVAGPDADPTGAVVLTKARNHAVIRATAAPELLVRSADVIDVVALPPEST